MCFLSIATVRIQRRKEKKLTIFVVHIHSGNGDESLKSFFVLFIFQSKDVLDIT